MSEALESNIENLTRQVQELQGAMALCRKMQENGEQIETFDAEKYWNAVEEEERRALDGTGHIGYFSCGFGDNQVSKMMSIEANAQET